MCFKCFGDSTGYEEHENHSGRVHVPVSGLVLSGTDSEGGSRLSSRLLTLFLKWISSLRRCFTWDDSSGRGCPFTAKTQTLFLTVLSNTLFKLVKMHLSMLVFILTNCQTFHWLLCFYFRHVFFYPKPSHNIKHQTCSNLLWFCHFMQLFTYNEDKKIKSSS